MWDLKKNHCIIIILKKFNINIIKLSCIRSISTFQLSQYERPFIAPLSDLGFSQGSHVAFRCLIILVSPSLEYYPTCLFVCVCGGVPFNDSDVI